jgi:hypothetical protein
LGWCRDLPDRDRGARLQSRTIAALHRHRAHRREHRPRPQSIRRRLRLAAVRAFSAALRPQPRSDSAGRSAHAVEISGRRGPVVVLWDHPNGVVAGAHQDGATAVVGSDYQQHLHVIFYPALRGRRGALAAQPERLGSVCPAVRPVVLRRAHRLRRAAGGAAVGSRSLHSGRHCWWPVQSALYVQKSRGCPRRWLAGSDAPQPAGCPPVR